jgi:hypothetical protein
MGNHTDFQQCGFSPLLRCRPAQFALHSYGPANCGKGLKPLVDYNDNSEWNCGVNHA